MQTAIELVRELIPEPNGKVRGWASRVRSEYDNIGCDTVQDERHADSREAPIG